MILPPGDTDRLALVLGTEGAGVSAATCSVDLDVMIPMCAGVDSLNVAAASAVAFWELRPATDPVPELENPCRRFRYT